MSIIGKQSKLKGTLDFCQNTGYTKEYAEHLGYPVKFLQKFKASSLPLSFPKLHSSSSSSKLCYSDLHLLPSFNLEFFCNSNFPPNSISIFQALNNGETQVSSCSTSEIVNFFVNADILIASNVVFHRINPSCSWNCLDF